MLKALDEVMVDDTAGDPISGLKWTHKSLRKIQTVLAKEGYPISPPTISRLLQGRDYSLQVNHKRIASNPLVETNSFAILAAGVKPICVETGLSSVSMPKKENILAILRILVELGGKRGGR